MNTLDVLGFRISIEVMRGQFMDVYTSISVAKEPATSTKFTVTFIKARPPANSHDHDSLVFTNIGKDTTFN